MKRKVTGKCELCRKSKQLLLSHFLPRAVFKLLRNPGGLIENPVLVTAKVTVSTSKQVKDYLLCQGCEGRFNKLGENYVLQQMNHRKNFPLLDRLKVSPPIDFSLKEGAYSGLAIGVDTEKLAYFALSIVWRSAVHKWQAADGHVMASVNLGPYQEPIRIYLLGKTPFPSGVIVIVTACTDRESQNAAYAPTKRLGTPNNAIAFLACGIHFMIFLGTTDPPSLGNLCCVSSPKQLVFSRDIRRTTLHAYSALATTSHAVGVMKKT